MLSGLGALALGWHALSRARVIGSESRALAQRATAVSASGVDPFAVRDVAVLHYDALEEMSGARSFSLALLNSEGDGVVVTSINGRTESRTYAKAVVGGDCDTLLSPEEYRVVRSARLGEGVGAAAGSPPTRSVSSAGVQPVPPPVARDESGSPAGRDEERGAREDAEADAATDAVEAVDAGTDRERREAAPEAPTRTNPRTPAARTASAAPSVVGGDGEDVEVAQAAPATSATDREDAEVAPVAEGAEATQAAPATSATDRKNPEVTPASAVSDMAGEDQEDASAAPVNPAVRPASTAPTGSTAPGASAVTSGEQGSPEATSASASPSVANDQEITPVTGATSAPTAPSTRTASAGTSAMGDDREEREPRGLVSVIRRTIGRVGADSRAPVEAVRSGVGAARPIVSANVTVQSGPSATAAGRTGTSTSGTATAAEPRPEDPTDEGTGGDGAREADAPASEAHR